MGSRASERLVVSAPLPPSTNHLYGTSKTGRRYLTAEAREYKLELQKMMMLQGLKSKCPEPPFSLHLHLRLPDKRRRDVSNAVKLLEDSIFAYLGYDDSLVYDLHVWKYYAKDDPGATVELRHCNRKLEEAS